MIDRGILLRLLSLEDLPTLPQVVVRIIDIVGNEESSVKDLTAVLKSDPAISARVLRVANSPFYGLSTKVDSIDRAVVYIGFDTVKMLALATTVFGIFGSQAQSAFDPGDFWLHSFGAAKAAQIVTRRVGGVESPDACFTGGLLHDIGKYLLSLCLGDEYVQICQTARARNRPVCEVEFETLQTTHAQVGGWISAHWRFPSAITTIISRQREIPVYRGPFAREAGIGALACAVSRLAGFGLACDPQVQPTARDLANSLELGKDDVVAIAQEAAKNRENTITLLNLLSRS